MNYVTAAAFPIAYGTSHGALDWRGRLRAGEVLLYCWFTERPEALG